MYECVKRLRGSWLGKSGTEEVECKRKMESRQRVAGAIRFLVNARDLQLQCARFLHKALLVPVWQ